MSLPALLARVRRLIAAGTVEGLEASVGALYHADTATCSISQRQEAAQ